MKKSEINGYIWNMGNTHVVGWKGKEELFKILSKKNKKLRRVQDQESQEKNENQEEGWCSGYIELQVKESSPP